MTRSQKSRMVLQWAGARQTCERLLEAHLAGRDLLEEILRLGAFGDQIILENDGIFATAWENLDAVKAVKASKYGAK